MKITNEVIIERLDNIIEQDSKDRITNKEEHAEMNAGIKHTNGDVSDLKLKQAKMEGAVKVIAIIITGIVIPLVFKVLSISLFN